MEGNSRQMGQSYRQSIAGKNHFPNTNTVTSFHFDFPEIGCYGNLKTCVPWLILLNESVNSK